MQLLESYKKIDRLESFAEQKSFLNNRYPAVKILTTVLYLIAVSAVSIYDIKKILVLLLYPVILLTLAKVPYKVLLARLLLVLPFACFAGLSNIFFNRTTAFVVGSLTISFGTLSFFVIFIKTLSSVSAVLLLIASTPFDTICNQLLQFRVPSILVTQLMLTYRYITCIIEEAKNMYTVYLIRKPSAKRILFSDIAPFISTLLLRSIDRSERLYYAMKCRGFSGGYFAKKTVLTKIDLFYAATVSAFSIAPFVIFV